MKHKRSIAFISALLFCLSGICQQGYIIPKHIFQPYLVLGIPEKDYGNGYEIDTAKFNFKMDIDSFEISNQITFKQYKLFLESIKKDSAYNFYVSRLPDSNITSKENYAIYLSDKKYDNFPVAGISWEAAMSYCKWRTLREKKDMDLKFIYRLPKLGEWLAAYNFLEINNRQNDFNTNFSDWTMSTYSEGIFGFKNYFVCDLFSDLPKATESYGANRKIVAGNSYLFQSRKLMYGFATCSYMGYRQIAFRLVKEEIKNSDDRNSLYKNVSARWGVEIKQ